MTRRPRQKMYVFAAVLLLTAGLYFSRYQWLFGFQQIQLKRFGCSSAKRLAGNLDINNPSPCQKLWVHRVDSYERFLALKDHFAGLETDVVFDRAIKGFRVYHPPAEPSPLLLDRYLAAFKQQNKGLWIDVKELDPADSLPAVNFFIERDRLYGIKKNVIIESSDARFVNRLAMQGFITALLVPPQILDGSLPAQAGDSLRAMLLPQVKFVSQEDRLLPALKKLFPGHKIITWSLSFSNFYNGPVIKSLMADTAISVVLLNIKSEGYL